MINFSGIFSGLDTNALINSTLQAQRQPLNRLQIKRGGIEGEISQLGQVSSLMGKLKSLAEDMQKVGNVLAFTGTTGDEEVLTATAGGEAGAGSYDIDVTQLATGEKNRTQTGFASAISGVKAGTITIATAGNDPVDIEVVDGDTLTEVADKINASGAGVDASLVFDGTNHYLQVSAAETGHEIGGNADDAVVITESYTGTEGDELSLAQVTQAANATLTVDGLAVEARGNTLAETIQGVTLELVTEGVTSLQVSPNAEGTKENLQTFVDTYNEVFDLLDARTRTAEGARRVNSDPALEQLRSALGSIVSRTVEGVQSGFSSLAQVGVETDSSGHLTIDSETLDNSLDSGLRSIGNLFASADTGLGAQLVSLADRFIDPTDGVLAGRQTALRGRTGGYDRQIERMENRLERTEVTMRRRFAALEATLSSLSLQGSALVGLGAPFSNS